MRVVINWVRFANGMPRFQEQSMWPQGTAVYDLDIIKIKFVVVFLTVLCQKRVLVTCEDGSFKFFCSDRISVLWMFDRCKVFHSFYNWFYTRHQLTGHDRICPSWQQLICLWWRFLQTNIRLSHGFTCKCHLGKFGDGTRRRESVKYCTTLP